MSTGIDPHPADEPGFIVAWRSKKAFEAGKFLDEEMTFGEARDKAAKLSAEHPDKTYWAERKPFVYEAH